MKIFNKNNGFYLESKTGKPIDDNKTLEAIKEALQARGIQAKYIIVNWDNKYITPSVDGVKLSHIKTEFTTQVKSIVNASEIIPPAVRKLDTTVKTTKLETTGSELKANIIGYILQHGKLRIIAKGTKKNWGNIYSLHVNSHEKVKGLAQGNICNHVRPLWYAW